MIYNVFGSTEPNPSYSVCVRVTIWSISGTVVNVSVILSTTEPLNPPSCNVIEPVTPNEPVISAEPVNGKPAPVKPEVPAVPFVPLIPDVPSAPLVPAVPVFPDFPVFPAFPVFHVFPVFISPISKVRFSKFIMLQH